MKLGYICLAAVLIVGIAAPVLSQDSVAPIKAATTDTFVKKRYTIHGDWTVKTDNGETVIAFDENFKTKGGPDLKVFLSPKPIDTLSGQTALNEALYLGVLKSNKGAQTYKVPADVDLSNFESLIIQCEAYSVLWGGFDLPSGDS